MHSHTIVALAIAATCLSACTRVETGEVGLRKSWSGVVETQELGTGWHQTLVGDVLLFSSRETLVPVDNMQPQTADKITMKDVDINFTYAVAPAAIGELYVKYSQSAHHREPSKGETYIMMTFVTALVRAAAYDAINQHDALKVSDNRAAIETEIKRLVDARLRAEQLHDKISVSQVVLRNVAIPDPLADSANAIARAENERKTKETEVKTARLEAERIEALAKQADDRYIRFLGAQAQLELAKKASGTVWVVPSNFNGMMPIQAR
jgi:regulator of protease activity HflC (stomatin/prohibitin superfamily)